MSRLGKLSIPIPTKPFELGITCSLNSSEGKRWRVGPKSATLVPCEQKYSGVGKMQKVIQGDYVTIISDFELNLMSRENFILNPQNNSFINILNNQISMKIMPENTTMRKTRYTRLKAKKLSMVWGTYQRLLSSLIKNYQNPDFLDIDFVGLGYKATVKDQYLELKLGYSHPIQIIIPEGINVQFPTKDTGGDGKKTRLRLRGAKLQNLVEFADSIRQFRPPECYKGKGVAIITRKFEERLNYRRKVGKKTS